MSKSNKKKDSISSPLSTGGAGTFFEQHVGTYLLTVLLVRGIPPILLDCYVSEVSLQNERLGFHTDDFLVVGNRSDGSQRKLLGQVKRTFTVSASDPDCKGAITDCWLDFVGTKFSAATDRFAIVTLRGSNVLLEHFEGLLACARTANDASEFETRLSTKGLLSKKSHDYYFEIKTIVSESEGKEVGASELWPFLRVLYLLSLDLNSSTSQHESMSKSLLAHTCELEDPLTAASNAWNSLLDEVGKGMGTARTFKFESLPKELRKQHSPVQHKDHVALDQLQKHSIGILKTIRSSLGTKQQIHLPRSLPLQKLLEQLRLHKVVVVSGHAGSGKSGVAKDALLALGDDYFCFCFRADEFARPHFDETLKQANVSVGASTLAAILSAQDRKVLLIESIERLLEKSERDAFSDLLAVVRDDPTWQLILTCRDYSTAQVKAFLLDAYAFDSEVIDIPGLDDTELQEVTTYSPSMARPLSNESLRNLLRNPYFLDKALQMPWSADTPLPENERAFRRKFWSEVIKGSVLEQGVHIERERVFVEIALRRARALSMFADATNLDASILQSLNRDSLITMCVSSSDLVAPAHDVLEDWAVIQWIESSWERCSGSLQKLSEFIGAHPSVRRSYRKWISELLERDATTADELFQGIVTDNTLPLYFSDDTLVCFLRSSRGSEFLRRHERLLFNDDKDLFRRIIHLLRVACVAPIGWLSNLNVALSMFNAPEGDAWSTVLEIVQANIDTFDQKSAPLLLGFIEDWARGVGWNSVYPPGSAAVGMIAFHLLDQFDNFDWSEQRKRTLKVIAKIPMADSQRFESLLRRNSTRAERDLMAADFREIIFEDMDGMPACRDLPNVVMEVFWESLFVEKERDPDTRFPFPYDDDLHMDNGRLFGLKRVSRLDYFPASAFQGPFIHLLKHHFQEAVRFITSIFNECGKAYKDACVSRGHEPHTTEFTFPDGLKAKQICNEVFWNIYRGRSVTPSVLQSALMALEQILLEYADADAKGLDGFLMSVIRASETVALTSVIASVAVANPKRTPSTLLVLLSSPESFILDRRRMSQDLTGSLIGLFPNLDSSKQIFYDERKKSDERQHRKNDLEFAIKTLQLCPTAEAVQMLIDQHLSSLPLPQEQRDFEQTWRLALHRMDLRQYTIEPFEPEASEEEGAENSGRFLIIPKPPAEDLQPIVDKSNAEYSEFTGILNFKMWGEKVFVGADSSSFPPAQWQQRLEQAKTIPYDSPIDQFHAARTGATSVAALCVRYHWDELNKTDQDWCIKTICTELERNADIRDRMERVQREGPGGGRAAAWVIPLLLGKQIPKKLRDRALKCLSLAMTHPVEEIRIYAVWGVAAHLWKADRALLFRCINAIAAEATLIEERIRKESRKAYAKRKFPETIQVEVTKLIRKGFFDDSVVSHDAYENLDITGGFGAHANSQIISIMQECPNEPLAVACFQRATTTLAEWWKADRYGRGGGDYEVESQLTKALEEFLFACSEQDAESILQPLLDSVEDYPDKLHWLIIGLLSAEDQTPKTERFWFLWQLFADRILRASWMDNIAAQHPWGRELIYALFLVTRWKENVRHWRSLEGYAHKVDDLFIKLRPSGLILNAYCSFLCHIGERSMPHAFTLIAEKLKGENTRKILTWKSDTIFMLETLLQRHVYGKPADLKRSEKRRESVLFLLEQLIENGSSAAYRMRDDFVTPMVQSALNTSSI